MSIRYVWEKYNVNITYTEDVKNSTFHLLDTFNPISLESGTGYETTGNNFNLTNTTSDLFGPGSSGNASGYFASSYKYVKRYKYGNIIYYAVNPKSTDRWAIKPYNDNYSKLYLGKDDYSLPLSESGSTIQRITRLEQQSIGSFLEYVIR